MRRFFGTIFVLTGAIALSVGPAAGVESEEPVEIRFDVPTVDDDNPEIRRGSREEIAKRANERIRARLDAAEIQYLNVSTTDNGRIVVEVDAEFDRELVEATVVPAGRFQLRPIVAVGSRWTQLSSEMPEGLEIRTGSEPLEPNNAYVWSKSRRKLQRFLEEVSIPEGAVAVYPSDDGWRSVTLADPLLSDERLESAEIRRVRTGSPFVTVTFESGIGRSASERERRLAAVIDGEVVSVMKASALHEQTLSIPTPDHLSGWEASMRWARQVAGRLAVTMPVTLVPTEEWKKDG